MKLGQGLTGEWLPTAENINALPSGVRQYIHDLTAVGDISFIVHENVFMRDQVLGLSLMYRKAQDELDLLRAESATGRGES